MSAAKLTPHDARRVAVTAGTDPRTVEAFVAGRPMRSTTASRVAEAMRSLGMETPPPDDSGGVEARVH
jgi:hypothetical protein